RLAGTDEILNALILSAFDPLSSGGTHEAWRGEHLQGNRRPLRLRDLKVTREPVPDLAAAAAPRPPLPLEQNPLLHLRRLARFIDPVDDSADVLEHAAARLRSQPAQRPDVDPEPTP